MYCQVCKIEYPEGKKFCKKCGSPLVEKGTICPKCRAPLTLKPDDKYCNECGAPLTQIETRPQAAVKAPLKSHYKPFLILIIIFGSIVLAGLGTVVLYHFYHFKVPYVEKYIQWVESKIWKVPSDTLAKAKTVREEVEVYPIDDGLYVEGGTNKLMYQSSGKPAIPVGKLKKGEVVDVISIGKRRDGERDRIGVKIRSRSGVVGYVGVFGDVEILRTFNDEAEWLLLPVKLSYEWEGDPETAIHDAKVYEGFIKSFPTSKYFPNAKLILSLYYWASSSLYQDPQQPYLQKDLKKAEFYRSLARNNLKDILTRSPDSKLAIIANKYLKKIERGEKHPYVTQDEKEKKSYWALMKELERRPGR